MGSTRFSHKLQTGLQYSMIIYKNVILTEILPCPMDKRGFAYTDSEVNVIGVIDTNHCKPGWLYPKKSLSPSPAFAEISKLPCHRHRA